MNKTLNVKQFAIAWLVVFVIMTIFAYVPMKLEIAPWVVPSSTVAQADEMTKRILIYLARLVASGLFAYIFTKTTEGKEGIGHGFRYGFGISMFMYVPWLISGLGISDWSATALFTRAIVGIVELVICGGAIAYLFKPAKPAAA